MIDPLAKPKRKEPKFVPHPDDMADVREAFQVSRETDVLSPEKSAEYLRQLLGNDSTA